MEMKNRVFFWQIVGNRGFWRGTICNINIIHLWKKICSIAREVLKMLFSLNESSTYHSPNANVKFFRMEKKELVS